MLKYFYFRQMILRFPDGADASQDIYARNGIWHPSSFTAHNVSLLYICCPYPWSHVIYTIRLQRESKFFRETIILPAVFLTVLMATVSWLHPASGEKMTLAVSNLLALILFQQLVADSMPPIGDNTSIIGTTDSFTVNTSVTPLHRLQLDRFLVICHNVILVRLFVVYSTGLIDVTEI